ncbi:IclR family transcriptional regulator [Streptomyces sp. NBC_00203]|uniref:IclR family transcriptional regulator n=1 Tax=Streptomyces sp. NBC_00203 TaxID=2975680 RepID=UPI0032458E3D
MQGRGVLDGAFALLDAVEQAGEARLSALAADSGLPKSTARRLLEQLVELGALERSGGLFRMGSRMFRLGMGWQPSPGILAGARGPVHELARATGATVALFVLREGRTIAVTAVPGELEPLLPVRAGMTFPWTTAAGKVLVAGAPSGLPVDGPPGAWRREAATIRDAGFAVDHQEVVDGVCCVAVPLRDRTAAAVAALCVLVDSTRPLPALTDAAIRAGRAISATIG